MDCPATHCGMPEAKDEIRVERGCAPAPEEVIVEAVASLTLEEKTPELEEMREEEEEQEKVDLDFCRIALLYNAVPLAAGKKKETHTFMLEFFNRFHYTAEEILKNPGVLKNLGGQKISDDPAAPASEQRFVQPMSTFLESPNPDHGAQVKEMLERNKDIHESLAQLGVLEKDHRVDIAPFSAVPYLRSLDVLSKDVDKETGEAAWYTVINLKNGKLRNPSQGRQSTIDAPWIYGEWWTQTGQHICTPKPAEDDVLARFKEIPNHVAWFLPNTLLVDTMTLRLFDSRFVKALFINEDPSRPWLVRSVRVFIDKDNLVPYMRFVKEIQQPLVDATKKHCDELFGARRKLAAVLDACPDRAPAAP